jgi:molybdopterin-guanine dinucleotide biosynthesis protein A
MERTLAAVLAGGRGSRLGGDKAGVELGGRPLIDYPLAAIEEAGLEAVVCVKPGQELPPLASFAGPGPAKEPRNPVPVLVEPLEPRHPLCGIVAALRAGEGRPVLAVACDLPFLAAGLIEALAGAPEPLVVPALAGAPEPLVVPALAGRLQPLLARYDPVLLPRLEAALEEEAPLIGTVESLRPRLLGEDELARFGDPHRLLFNVNEPDDLREAEALL